MAYLSDRQGTYLLDSYGYNLSVKVEEILSLITDRVALDAQYVSQLASKGLSMNDKEIEAWLGGLKGAYNCTDLNRIEHAVDYLCDKMHSVGWNILPDVRTNWTHKDFPTNSEMKRYLNNVRLLRNALPANMPDVPTDMNRLTFEEANSIELVLRKIDEAIENIMQISFYCNEVYSGEVRLNDR